METRTSESFINQYDEISKYCHETGEPVCIKNSDNSNLIVISFDKYKRREQIYALREQLYEVEIARAKGAKDYSPKELDEAMRKIIGL